MSHENRGQRREEVHEFESVFVPKKINRASKQVMSFWSSHPQILELRMRPGALLLGLVTAVHASHFLITNTGFRCRGKSAPVSPGSGYTANANGEYYWNDHNIGQSACADKCRSLAGWNFGCRHFSYGDGWCYVHLDCHHLDIEALYSTFDKREDCIMQRVFKSCVGMASHGAASAAECRTACLEEEGCTRAAWSGTACAITQTSNQCGAEVNGGSGISDVWGKCCGKSCGDVVWVKHPAQELVGKCKSVSNRFGATSDGYWDSQTVQQCKQRCLDADGACNGINFSPGGGCVLRLCPGGQSDLSGWSGGDAYKVQVPSRWDLHTSYRFASLAPMTAYTTAERQGIAGEAKCAAHFGSTDACCGQPGTNVAAQYICPEWLPECVGYVNGANWGTCGDSTGCKDCGEGGYSCAVNDVVADCGLFCDATPGCLGFYTHLSGANAGRCCRVKQVPSFGVENLDVSFFTMSRGQSDLTGWITTAGYCRFNGVAGSYGGYCPNYFMDSVADCQRLCASWEECAAAEVVRSAYPAMVWSAGGCNSAAPCGQCEAGCSSDTDCAGSLKCFQRSGDEDVPGCTAGGVGDVSADSYCYDEAIECILMVPSTTVTSACPKLYRGKHSGYISSPIVGTTTGSFYSGDGTTAGSCITKLPSLPSALVCPAVINITVPDSALTASSTKSDCLNKHGWRIAEASSSWDDSKTINDKTVNGSNTYPATSYGHHSSIIHYPNQHGHPHTYYPHLDTPLATAGFGANHQTVATEAGASSGGGPNPTDAWCPLNTDYDHWLMFDLGFTHTITGIMTQGRAVSLAGIHWVSKYHVKYSMDTLDWRALTDGSTNNMAIFSANYDTHTIVSNYLSSALATRYLRIHPFEWEGYPSMRVGLIGCANDYSAGKPQAPAAPSLTTPGLTTDTSTYKLVVSWERPLSPHGAITGYAVSVSDGTGKVNTRFVHSNAGGTKFHAYEGQFVNARYFPGHTTPEKQFSYLGTATCDSYAFVAHSTNLDKPAFRSIDTCAQACQSLDTCTAFYASDSLCTAYTGPVSARYPFSVYPSGDFAGCFEKVGQYNYYVTEGKKYRHLTIPAPGPIYVEGYTNMGTYAVCDGTQLTMNGPNWEVAQGISACKNLCDGSSCGGWVWWEDYSCRTYDTCHGTTADVMGISHVYQRDWTAKVSAAFLESLELAAESYTEFVLYSGTSAGQGTGSFQLEGAEAYTVTIAAINHVGASVMSASTTITTPAAVPSKPGQADNSISMGGNEAFPTSAQVSNIETTQLMLNWPAASGNGAPVSGYNIQIKGGDQWLGKWITFSGGNMFTTSYSGGTEHEKDVSCAEQCNTHAQCEAWVRSTVDSACILKNSYTGTVRTSYSLERRGNIRGNTQIVGDNFYHCFNGVGGACSDFNGEAYPVSDWDTSYNAAFTNTETGFGAYCSSLAANMGVFNGGAGQCPPPGTIGRVWENWVSNTGSSSLSATITGLLPGQTYSFRVAGINAQGVSGFFTNPSRSIKMRNAVPDQLAAPTLTGLTQTGVNVNWLPPQRPNGLPVLYYVIFLTFTEPQWCYDQTAPALTYVINTDSPPAATVDFGADGVPPTVHSMHGVEKFTFDGKQCYEQKSGYENGYYYCSNYEANTVALAVGTIEQCERYCSANAACTHYTWYPELSAREQSNKCYIITSCGTLIHEHDTPKHDVPYYMVKARYKCGSARTHQGAKTNALICAGSCKAIGYSYFLWGRANGGRGGRCWCEHTTASSCPEGWQSGPPYDFYAITPADMPPLFNAKTAVKLSTTYCASGDHSWTVPSKCTQIHVSLWGAGGGGGVWAPNGATPGGRAGGGGGGFTSGLLNVSPTETLTIIVGEGGFCGRGDTVGAHGGGGRVTAGSVAGSSGCTAGGGGGRSAIRYAWSGDLITAGGAGGGGGGQNIDGNGVVTPYSGGGGGGLTGQPGQKMTGTQTLGGTQSAKGTGNGLHEGDQHQGGYSNNWRRGAGGGGFYGGAAAADEDGGGGGSSYLGDPTATWVESGQTESGSYAAGNGDGGLPGGMDSTYYPRGIGIGRGGSPGGAGQSGYVVLSDWGHCPGLTSTSLHSNTQYTISVGAVNGVGQAAMSPETTFTTVPAAGI